MYLSFTTSNIIGFSVKFICIRLKISKNFTVVKQTLKIIDIIRLTFPPLKNF